MSIFKKSVSTFLFATLALWFPIRTLGQDQIANIHSSAERGNPAAMNMLGNIYLKGTPNQKIASDPATAISWYERAAKAGYPAAYFNLGLAYEKGHGVPQDLQKSQAYFFRAQELGFERAREKVKNPEVAQQQSMQLFGREASLKAQKRFPPPAGGGKMPMIEVIDVCENKLGFSNFSELLDCIKVGYRDYGNRPNSLDVKNFFRLVESINEEFIDKKITSAKARAEMIKAWQSTIDTSNKFNESQASGVNPAGIDLVTQDAARRAADAAGRAATSIDLLRGIRFQECINRNRPNEICLY